MFNYLNFILKVHTPLCGLKGMKFLVVASTITINDVILTKK